MPLLDGPGLTLALVEAHVGSLMEVLPVALLVTNASGEILRANEAAVELMDNAFPLVGQTMSGILDEVRRKKTLKVRLRWLRHQDQVLRLYVIDEAER